MFNLRNLLRNFDSISLRVVDIFNDKFSRKIGEEIYKILSSKAALERKSGMLIDHVKLLKLFNDSANPYDPTENFISNTDNIIYGNIFLKNPEKFLEIVRFSLDNYEDLSKLKIDFYDYEKDSDGWKEYKGVIYSTTLKIWYEEEEEEEEEEN
jgi:hypothetical protein